MKKQPWEMLGRRWASLTQSHTFFILTHALRASLSQYTDCKCGLSFCGALAIFHHTKGACNHIKHPTCSCGYRSVLACAGGGRERELTEGRLLFSKFLGQYFPSHCGTSDKILTNHRVALKYCSKVVETFARESSTRF